MKLDRTDEGGRSTGLPSSLAIFAWGLPLLWVLSILKIIWERLIVRDPNKWVLPHHFDDFVCYWLRLRMLHTMAFFDAPDNKLYGSGWGYPSPAVWIYRFFYLFDPLHVERPYRGFAVMVVLGLGGAVWAAFRLGQAMEQRGLRRSSAFWLLGSALIFSWPLFFVLQRGNIELLLWLPLAAAIAALARRRWMMAAVLIGLTASFKLYPILLLGLFLRDRRYREMLVGLVLPVGVTLLSLWYIGPTLPIAAQHIGLGIGGFIQDHGARINWWTEGYNHSLFHLIKVNANGHASELGSMLPWYMGGIALVMTAVFFLRVLKLPMPNQVLVLVLSMIYFPPTSYDYTLQVMFLPWAWLGLIAISRARRREAVPGMSVVMMLFTLLLGPELFLTTRRYLHSGSLKAVCLGALLVAALVFPFGDPDAKEPEERVGSLA